MEGSRFKIAYLVLLPTLLVAACVLGYYTYLTAVQFERLGEKSIADSGLLLVRDKISRGKFNIGGYCNDKVDALTDMILSETDAGKRNAMIEEAYAMTIGDIAYVPLHQQALAWGVKNSVELAQRADNQFAWRHVMVK